MIAYCACALQVTPPFYFLLGWRITVLQRPLLHFLLSGSLPQRSEIVRLSSLTF